MSLKFPISLAGKGGGGGDIELSYVASYTDLGNSSNYTFTSCDLGAPDADRQIIVTMAYRSYGANSIAAVYVGGLLATADQPKVTGSNGVSAAVYRAALPAGATGNIQVIISGTGLQNLAIDVYRAVSSSMSVEAALGVDSGGGTVRNFTISAIAGGGLVGVAGIRPDSSGSASVRWTAGLTNHRSLKDSGLFFMGAGSHTATETDPSFAAQVNMGSSYYSPPPICIVSYRP